MRKFFSFGMSALMIVLLSGCGATDRCSNVEMQTNLIPPDKSGSGFHLNVAMNNAGDDPMTVTGILRGPGGQQTKEGPITVSANGHNNMDFGQLDIDGPTFMRLYLKMGQGMTINAEKQASFDDLKKAG